MTIIVISKRAREGAADTSNGFPEELQPLVKAWTDVCRDKDFRNSRNTYYIDYCPLIDIGRWGCKPRVRKFVVRSPHDLSILASSKTLEGAMRLASTFGI